MVAFAPSSEALHKPETCARAQGSYANSDARGTCKSSTARDLATATCTEHIRLVSCSRDPIGYVDGYSLYGAYFVPNYLDPTGTEWGGVVITLLNGELGRQRELNQQIRRSQQRILGKDPWNLAQNLRRIQTNGAEDAAQIAGALIELEAEAASAIIGGTVLRTGRGPFGYPAGLNKCSVGNLVGKLPGKIGKTGPIKTVPDEDTLKDLFDEMTKDGVVINPGRYPGEVRLLPDGTVVRIRPESKSIGPAIDITMPTGRIIKIHVE